MNNLSIRKMNEMTKKKKKGFTLIELIIVIAIIAILAAMAIPKFSSIRIDAKVSNDVAAAKNIQTQIATAIANGTITVPTTAPPATTLVPSTIYKNLDGNVGTGGKAEAITADAFYYLVGIDGGIAVCVGDGTGLADATPTATSTVFELYPDNKTLNRPLYAAAAKK